MNYQTSVFLFDANRTRLWLTYPNKFTTNKLSACVDVIIDNDDDKKSKTTNNKRNLLQIKLMT